MIFSLPEDFGEDVEVYKFGLTDAESVKSSLSGDEEYITAENSKFGNYAVCDFSDASVADTAEDKALGLKAFIDDSLIFKISTAVLAGLCLALIIVLIIVIVKKRKPKNS